MGLLAQLKTHFVLQLLMGFVFVVSGLIINFIQLLTCVLWPINKQLYRKINTRLSYSLWSQLVMLLEWWSGTECTLFADQATADKLGKEHAIIILNHNYEIDFLCGWTICERYGVLGSSKVLAKHELLKVPLIGWTWYFLEIVFCKRKWEEDRDTVFRGLNRLKDYPEFMWFLLYCEGTRFTEKKHQISMEVAESKGLPKLKYHLLPRTKGFTTTLKCLKGTVSAVYDVTLNFRDHQVPTLLGIVNGRKYMADMSVRRFPVENIPEDEKECADWLHKIYQEKDALQDLYHKEGTFPGPSFTQPRRCWTLLNFFFWAALLLSPLINFACGVAVSGSPLLILGFICIIPDKSSIAIRRLIGVTEVHKTGSSYGDEGAKKQN
uniref:Phospholipid/glycerol acyltransferase domain-containing protein n=1 Tax=Esox lucius TaxID=8010 RepID=A0A6Q2ZEG8_ESOLU